MNFLMLARVAKLVALLGFILPWVVVSCSGTEILQATGIQLMTGDMQPTAAFEQAQAQSQSSGGSENDGPEPSIPAIAAFSAIAIGLLLSLVTKGRAAAGAIMITAAAGLGLSYYAVDKLESDLSRSMQESANQGQSQSGSPFASGGPSPSQMGAAFQVEEKEGYWLTMGALGAAVILALLMLGAAAPAAAARQDPPPPAA